MEARRTERDLEGAIEAAEHWAAPDPLDDEAQHVLVQVLAEAGERSEAIRRYETYARLLAREELRPLDETVALIEGLLSAAPAPTRPWKAAGDAMTGSPAAAAPVPEEGSGREAIPAVSAASSGRPERRLAAGGTPPRRRRAGLLAMAAAALLALLLGAGSLVGRATGLGSLGQPARAALEEGERVVLADFGTTAADPALGTLTSDLLRIDLLENRTLRVLERSEVRESLARMQVSADAPLSSELAREVALREGAKAVLEGEVVRHWVG